MSLLHQNRTLKSSLSSHEYIDTIRWISWWCEQCRQVHQNRWIRSVSVRKYERVRNFEFSLEALFNTHSIRTKWVLSCLSSISLDNNLTYSKWSCKPHYSRAHSKRLHVLKHSHLFQYTQYSQTHTVHILVLSISSTHSHTQKDLMHTYVTLEPQVAGRRGVID